MKIADRLSELVAHERQHQQYLLPTHIDRAERQLRALLAVARAARKMSRFSIPPRDWHTPGEDARRATFRALARLDRVSGERKGGK